MPPPERPAPAPPPHLLITCEHGGNTIPAEPASLRPLFRAHKRLLSSHRGWDRGSLELARMFAHVHSAELHASTTSRLVVDLNRSPDHPSVLSAWTAALPSAERQRLFTLHHTPYRARVERSVARAIAQGRPVLHISVHSFTPVFKGHRRTTDIGLLFDPRRPGESLFIARWLPELKHSLPRLRIVRNSPYRGWTDGLVTHLRALHPDHLYTGIELEINQRFPRASAARWSKLQSTIVASLP